MVETLTGTNRSAGLSVQELIKYDNQVEDCTALKNMSSRLGGNG